LPRREPQRVERGHNREGVEKDPAQLGPGELGLVYPDENQLGMRAYIEKRVNVRTSSEKAFCRPKPRAMIAAIGSIMDTRMNPISEAMADSNAGPERLSTGARGLDGESAICLKYTSGALV
jgi:hypothetical protein